MPSSNKRLFIEIEAPDFAGKTTLCNNLKKLLFGNFCFIRLPGFTDIGEEIRNIIKYKKISPEVSLGLAFASHMDAYDNMDEAKNYIVDRALTSCFVYQGLMQGLIHSQNALFNEFIKVIKDKIDKKFERYVVYLKLSAEDIYKRKMQSGRENCEKDNFDNLSMDKLKFLVKSYETAIFSNSKINTPDRVKVIDALKNPTDVCNEVLDFINLIQLN